MIHHLVFEGLEGEQKCLSPPLVKSSGRVRTVFSGMAMLFTGWCWGSVSDHSSKAPYCTLVCVCLFVWATHGHMHTWRSKTSQQSRFLPLVSAHKASPWQLRQNLNMKTERLSFFRLILVFLAWFLALTKIPTIIISNDNNLYSINYLYCTIISPRIDLQQRGAFFQSKAIHSQFLFLCPRFSKASAEHTEVDRQQASFFFLLLLSCTEIKQDILQEKKSNPNKKQSRCIIEDTG